MPSCQYETPDNTSCSNSANDSGLCYWHDPAENKRGDDVKGKLEAYAAAGGLLQGLQLHHANLESINLVNHNSKHGYDFSGSDFYRANLKDAHLYNINLQNGSLMKADLHAASLHCAQLQNTNLLGAKLNGSRIEHINVGNELQQETLAHAANQKGDTETATDFFEQSEEIYRNLRKAAEKQGLFAQGGSFIHRELIMRRYCYPLYSRERLTSKLIDLFCGYGERPTNVIVFSLSLILFCAFLYFFLGVSHAGETLQFNSIQHSPLENLKIFFGSLYFSVVTFTTLGYGDITPIGASRFVAACEAFSGSFTLALFVVVFVKKMTR